MKKRASPPSSRPVCSFSALSTPTYARMVPRGLPHALRRLSYLHLLLLPPLLILFHELPWRFDHPFLPSRLRLSSLPPVVHLLSDLPNRLLLPNLVSPVSPPVAPPGASLVVCCMNRHVTLQTAIDHWRKVRNVSEIIIVDWSSEPPLHNILANHLRIDPRMRLIRVDAEPNWVLSRAYNLAVRAASFETVIRADCDYTLAPNFVRAHPIAPRTFYAGNYNAARNENEVHLNGAVVIRRNDFLRVGGYDERIQTYGWDDEDLYKRLSTAGFNKLNISYDYITHVPHADTARAQKDVRFVQVEIDLNSLLLAQLPKWNSSSLQHHSHQWAVTAQPHLRYAILHAVFKPRPLKDMLPPHKVADAWSTALGQRLANDYAIPWDIMVSMSSELRRKLLTRLNMRMKHRAASQPTRILFAHVMHGLGNRLRALGSAMAFAKHTDRELVVIWQMDNHIAAKFGDLFADDMLVLDSFKPQWPFAGYERYDTSWLNFEFFNYMEMEGKGALKGQFIVDKPDKHMYIKSAYKIEADSRLTGWDLDNLMLRDMTPVKVVRDLVDQFASQGLSSMVGVHIRDRTLDRDIKNVQFDKEYGGEASREMNYWRQKSSYRSFISEMQRMVDSEKSARFYVASDTIDVIAKLQSQFGNKIVSLKRDCDSRDGRCVQFALVDMLCLARARQLLGSNWSSFTEAASRLGGKKARLAGRDFAKDVNGVSLR